jgi:hypothetical protein
MTSESIKERLIEWLLQQGVSTILLCCILAFMGYGIIYMVPAHLEMIQSGFQKNAQELSRSIEMLAASHDRDREMFLRMLGTREVGK